MRLTFGSLSDGRLRIWRSWRRSFCWIFEWSSWLTRLMELMEFCVLRL